MSEERYWEHEARQEANMNDSDERTSLTLIEQLEHFKKQLHRAIEVVNEEEKWRSDYHALNNKLIESEAENAALKRYRIALQNIADTSPNWAQEDAIADSEMRMREIALNALLKGADDITEAHCAVCDKTIGECECKHGFWLGADEDCLLCIEEGNPPCTVGADDE